MQKNVFDYLEYSFKKIFSKEWANIIGSSLIVNMMAGILGLFVLIIGGYFLSRELPVSPLSLDMQGIYQGASIVLTTLLLIVILIFITKAWQAIVIPIRSIDPIQHFDWRGDFALFRSHFWRYMGYVTWYSLLMLVIWILYIVILVGVSAIDGMLGFLFGIIGFLSILYIMTLFYVAWYHVLSEGSGGWRIFWESKKFILGKAWNVFWKVFFFALIVLLTASTIESTLYGLLSWDITGGAWDELARKMEYSKSMNPPEVLLQIFAIIKEHPIAILTSWILMTILFSLSSVLSKAMFHIFYVRYYLDLRDEWEERNV